MSDARENLDIVRRSMAERRNTRGRPADAPPEEDPEFAGVRRVSRRGGHGGDFELPAAFRGKYPGRDFEWKTVSVIGEAAQASDMIRVAEGGWRPVPAELGVTHGLVPPGYVGTTIDREGQRLYWRPLYLSEEAKAEDTHLAEEQFQSRLGQQAETPVGHARRTYSELDMQVLAPVPRE